MSARVTRLEVRVWNLLIVSALAGDEKPPDAERVSAEFGIDGAMFVPSSETEATAHVLVTCPLVSHVGFSVSGRATTREMYGEVYVGPQFRFGELELTPSIGVETSDSPLRVAAAAAWQSEHLAAHGVIEHGGSGLWYQTLAKAVFDPVGLGIFAQRYAGIGPWVGFERQHVGLWLAGLYEPEEQVMDVTAGLEVSL